MTKNTHRLGSAPLEAVLTVAHNRTYEVLLNILPRSSPWGTVETVLRLAAHNAGRCPHTAGGGPWQLDVTVDFADERRALALERYLKSGSGVAFAKRHLR